MVRRKKVCFAYATKRKFNKIVTFIVNMHSSAATKQPLKIFKDSKLFFQGKTANAGIYVIRFE